MTTYYIPTADVMENDSGVEIHVISVGEPTNGETLLGTVSLSGTTIIYTSPPNTVTSTGARDSNILQRSGNFGIGSGYGLAQGGGVSNDVQVGDLCVLVYYCRNADLAAVQAALEPGWEQVATSGNSTRTVVMYRRWADAAYVAQHWQPKYEGNYAQFYPYFSSDFRQSGSCWTFSFRPPPGMQQSDFIQCMNVDAGDGPLFFMNSLYIDKPAYRYTFCDAIGNALDSTYTIPAQPANALTWGVTSTPTDFNAELTGDCDVGPYPDTATIHNTTDAVFWSFVINEIVGGSSTSTANLDCFGYTIQDLFGQTASANVYLNLPQGNSANTANTSPTLPGIS